MKHQRSPLPPEAREAIAEGITEAEAARRVGAVWASVFGPDGPPANLELTRWLDTIGFAALECYAHAFAHTPRKYHGWLLSVIQELVDPVMADPAVRAAIARGMRFDHAFDRRSNPWGEPLEVGYLPWHLQEALGNFLRPSRPDDRRRERRQNIFHWILDLLQSFEMETADPESSEQAGLGPALLGRPGGFALLNDAMDAEDGRCCRVAIRWLAELAPTPAAAIAALTPFLEHEAADVRSRTALDLVRLAPETPGLAAVLWAAVNEAGDQSDAARLYEALIQVGPPAWEDAGPPAIPVLAIALRNDEIRGQIVTVLERLAHSGYRAEVIAACRANLQGDCDAATIAAWRDLLGTGAWQEAALGALESILGMVSYFWRPFGSPNRWRWVDAVRQLRSIGLPTAKVLCALEDILAKPERMEEEFRWEILSVRQERQTVAETLESLEQRLQEGAGPLDAEEGFLLAVWETPRDALVPMVYADWLDEQGQAEKATVIRLQRQLETLATDAPGRMELESAMREAWSEVDRRWDRLWYWLRHPDRLARRGNVRSPALDSPPPITDPGAEP